MCDELPVRAQALVMRDLVDVLIGEDLFDLSQRRRPSPPAPLASQELVRGEQWYRVDLTDGWVAWRVRPATLQPHRYSRGGVWAAGGASDEPRVVTPDELLAILLADRVHGSGDAPASEHPGGAAAVDDLRTAVEHTTVTISQRRRLDGRLFGSGGLLTGERLAATRDRPFLPTARATVGWTADERGRYGPMRAEPMPLAWVAVRRTELRHGGGALSRRLHEALLGEDERLRLLEAMHAVGVDIDRFQPLPVHPWQFEHVLGAHFADEIAARTVVPLPGEFGRYHPTASVRTLATHPEGRHHVKLPLGVATLGATRLLPPRYLDNGERAQRTMAEVIGRSAPLRGLVAVCDERDWCGWADPDPYADRPGHLAAQLRRYPHGLLDDPRLVVLPMAALAAHEWDVLDRVLDMPAVPGGPVEFFGTVADALCLLGLGFVGFGTLPELHGQNVVIALRDGAVDRLVLRDHDTLRVYPDWMEAAGLPDPGYLVKPGGRQSLRLPSGRALLGYLQTLGFQVNLHGIADALGARYGIDESRFWARLRVAVVGAMDRAGLPGPVADVVARELLDAPAWPSRQVFGPLLRRGVSRDVSMPAATGSVPNPLRTAAPGSTPAARASCAATTGGAG